MRHTLSSRHKNDVAQHAFNGNIFPFHYSQIYSHNVNGFSCHNFSFFSFAGLLLVSLLPPLPTTIEALH